MNEPDQTIIFPMQAGDDLPESPSGYDDFTASEESPAADVAMGLANLGFITAALKRNALFWCVTALVGLLVGCGLYVKFPVPYQAATSVLLTNDPTEVPLDAIATDVTLAESPTVAARVIQDLRLPLSVTSFLASYTATGVTNEVLTITASAPSSSAALSRANTVATEFLKFRTSTLLAQQQLVIKAQEQQISQAQQNLNSIDSQISRISAQPVSSAQQSTLRSLHTQRDRVSGVLAALEATESANQATTQTTTASMIAGSEVLNAGIPLHHSHSKAAIEYVAAGFVFGLALGMGIVAVRALASGRLRRRDDIADALGGPVKLSVGKVRAHRRLLPRRGAASSDLNRRHVVGHLLRAIPRSHRGDPAGLAVVAVDNAQIVAGVVVSLAVTYASRGKQVVLADLSSGSHAARLLKVKKPGIHAVSPKGVRLVVTVPDRDDIVPVGPLQGGASRVQKENVSAALTDACASADLLLTLITLDPAFGGDHLATWATDAVVMVTAGESSAVRVGAVGEMVRLAGTRLASAVVMEADRGDESLGLAPAEDQPVTVGPR